MIRPWAYVKINGRDIWNARKARRKGVRGRDPNVTEKQVQGSRLTQPLLGPVTKPRAATRQNPLHGPQPCALGVSTAGSPNPRKNGPGHVHQHAAKPEFPAKRSSLRAPVTERRMSTPKVSQVLVFSLTCNGNRGQEANSVAGQPFFQDLRRFAASPAAPLARKRLFGCTRGAIPGTCARNGRFWCTRGTMVAGVGRKTQDAEGHQGVRGQAAHLGLRAVQV